VYTVSGQFTTGISSWDSGFCLWACGKHTLLSYLCMQFQVNWGHGIWNFASGYPGIKHCSALNCICSCRVNSLHVSLNGIRDSASGCTGSKHYSALNCECSFQVNSVQGLVHGIQDFAIFYGNAAVTMDIASGHQGSTQCSVLNCICSRV
jgi:hypothetical protein